MKKILVTLSLILCASISLFAKTPEERAKMRQEILDFKMEYLAKEMELSEKQKVEFTKTYQEYSELRHDASREARRCARELKKKKDATDADYKRLATLQDEAKQKDAEIVKRFDAKFESFLSAKQIYKMRQGEETFQKKLEQMQKDKKKSDRDTKTKGGKPSKGKKK